MTARDAAPPSIVLVDDSQDVRALVRRRLESSGFAIVGEGTDGDEGILLAHQHQPALLLLDTSMPRVDGLEALPVILAVAPTTKVVMFTGFEGLELRDKALELGVADFIEKSIRLEELPRRLLRILDGEAPHDARATLSVVAEHTDEIEQSLLSGHVQQFRELFDRAEIGMATLTSNGTVVRANQALAELMSCRPTDLIGVDYGRLTVGNAGELDGRLKEICSSGKDIAMFEHPLPAAIGTRPADVRTVRVTLSPVRDSRREVLYVFAQVQDVTAQRAMESTLRHSEENFRRLVTAVSEYAIYMLDADGNVISWNAGAQRIKGYTAHEIIGRPFRLFYPVEEQETGHPERNLRAALRDGTFAEEGWRVRKDGSRFWASVVISPVYDDAGSHVGFAKVTRDQTQARLHEDERGRFLEQRIHLLAVTAHELRTPTAVVDGSAETLQSSWEDLPPDERADLLGGIRTSADRLRRLAADLATASRLEEEMLSLRLENVSLDAILRAACTRRRAVQADVQITVDIAQDAVLLVDPERLGQALDNLLDNAVRHGVPPIRLTCTVAHDVRIRVTDAGPGVPSGLLPRLFERFTVGAGGGTGLGLFLVREIARSHGGDATYLGPRGEEPGAFEITLPMSA